MRKILILFWMLVPLSIAAYHYGPGQDRVTLDRAALDLRAAEDHAAAARELAADGRQDAANEEFLKAIELFDAALQRLPAERAEDIARIRLEKAKALFSSQQNPKARSELEALLADLTSAESPVDDDNLVADARDALAASQFYMAWLMRIEGHPREVWEPEADRSRQNYRMLAEAAEAAGANKDAQRARENLESAIRLALVELDELQGLPLPSQ